MFWINSEYKKIKAVLMCRPVSEINEIDNPEGALHLGKIDFAAIDKEFDAIINLYKKLKISVYFIDTSKIKKRGNPCLYNIMYTRDLLFMAQDGAIIAKMASVVRRGEVSFAKKALNDAGVPVIATIAGEATFEGADALWLSERLVMVGLGRRTNRAGFLQIKEALAKKGVSCVSVPAPQGSLHLLGAVQLVDAGLALVRTEIVSEEIKDILKRNKFGIINVSENRETKDRQAMNIVVVGPRRVIMPSRCPTTKKVYEKNKIKIAAELDLSELVKAAGGLACATAVISREK